MTYLRTSEFSRLRAGFFSNFRTNTSIELLFINRIKICYIHNFQQHSSQTEVKKHCPHFSYEQLELGQDFDEQKNPIVLTGWRILRLPTKRCWGACTSAGRLSFDLCAGPGPHLTGYSFLWQMEQGAVHLIPRCVCVTFQKSSGSLF
jgi:hypothetical protein